MGASLGLLGNRDILRGFGMEYFENSPGEVFLSKMYTQLVCHLFISVLRIYHSTQTVVKMRPYSSLDYNSALFLIDNSALFQS